MAISVEPLTLDSSILWLVEVAVKEYHTSSLTPVAPQVGAVSEDCVADAVVPAVTVPQLKSGFTVSATAPEQSSLAGGGGAASVS